jgi:hypothetical protein
MTLEKKHKVQIGLGILAVIVILSLIIWGPWWEGDEKADENSQDNISVQQVVPNTDSIQAAQLKSKLDSMEKAYRLEIDKKDKALADKDVTIMALAQKKVYVTVKSPIIQSAGSNTGTGSSSGDNKKVESSVSSDLSKTLKTNKTLVGEAPIEGACPLPVEFCVYTSPNGYWPDWAQEKGTKFPEMIDNKKGGYNLKIESHSSAISGRYGITTDGTIFVAASELDPCDGGVQVISNLTSWKLISMTRQGDYYTWKK